jgi:serine/threonine protein kinase
LHPLLCPQLIYKDLYACDLSVALSGGAIEAADKPYYVASLYAGLRCIHEIGILHRFVNASSVYVTTSGIPKVSFSHLFLFSTAGGIVHFRTSFTTAALLICFLILTSVYGFHLTVDRFATSGSPSQ